MEHPTRSIQMAAHEPTTDYPASTKFKAGSIKRAGIIIKNDNPEAQRIGEELAIWFSKKSITAVFNRIETNQDILVILGGDGSLLRVAAEAGSHDIPVVGINLGSLGFLTEIAINERLEVLETILAGEAVIENRMMLKARLLGPDGKNVSSSNFHFALNDIVLSKDNFDQLIQLSTWADQEYITTYTADGLIFSTPTGSTAYNLSAGGPIVHPCLPAILITPICPFMLESRPILLPKPTRLLTRIAGRVNKVRVIIDGRTTCDLQDDNILEVVAAEQPLKLISSPNKGYFDILRNKLNWGGRDNRLPLPLQNKKT